MGGFSTIWGVVYPLVALDPALNAYPAGRHVGNPGGLSAVDTDLLAENIKLGETIFGINGTMVSWVYDLQAKQAFGYKTIPSIPAKNVVTAESHAGGALTGSKALIIPTMTRAIVAENSMFLIDDCESNIWNEYDDAAVTPTIDAAVFEIGAHSSKFAVGAGANAGVRLATLAKGSMDLSAYNYIKMWVYSSIALNANDMQFLLDEHAQCVSPLKSLNIPAISATTWTEVLLALGDASALTAIISIGAYQAVDKGAFDLYFDQIRATKGA